MGKRSRDKGKRGEREVVDVFKTAGCDKAMRTAPLQAAGIEHGEADVRIGEGFHVEAKYQEVLRIPAWLRQLDRDCPEGAQGILAYRRSREAWKACITTELLDDLEEATDKPLVTVVSESKAVAHSGRVTVSLAELAERLVEAGRI